MDLITFIVNTFTSASRSRSVSFEKEPLSFFFLLYAKRKRLISPESIYELSFVYNTSNDSDSLYNTLASRFKNGINKSTISIYREIADTLCRIDDYEFCKEYSSIIETLLCRLSLYSGRLSGDFSQPSELSTLIGHIVESKHVKNVFNPFAGLGSYALIPSINDYYGQEINETTFLLAQIRLDSQGKSYHTIRNEDSLGDYWDRHNDADTLIATPPFGMRCSSRHDYQSRETQLVENYLIFNFIASTYLNKAIIVMDKRFCYDRKFFDARKTLVERGYVDMVIELPAGIFYTSAISTVVLVLDKNIGSRHSTIINGKECVKREGKFKILDWKRLFDIIKGDKESTVYHIEQKEVFKHNLSLRSLDYISAADNLESGQEAVILGNLIEPGEVISFSGDAGEVISPSNFADDIKKCLFADSALTAAKITPSFRAYSGPHIILSYLQNKIKICKYNSDGEFFINHNQIAYRIKNSADLSIDYLTYVLFNSSSLASITSHMDDSTGRNIRQYSRNILDCKVAIFNESVKQNSIIDSLKAEYVNDRKLERIAEDERLGIRTATSDLSHMLGVTFDKIGDNLSLLQSSADIDVEMIKSLKDNFAYLKRFISSFGDDFLKARMAKEETGVNEFINSYINSCANFGNTIFSIDYDKGVEDSTTVLIDQDYFKVLFDTLFDNAYRHGFRQSLNEGLNKVAISSNCRTMDGKEYILITIANNGEPLPIDFTIDKYITKGIYLGESGRSGLGGYHIHSIVKKHNGFMYITNSGAWNFILEILIPVEMYDETEFTNFKEYENDEQCI